MVVQVVGVEKIALVELKVELDMVCHTLCLRTKTAVQQLRYTAPSQAACRTLLNNIQCVSPEEAGSVEVPAPGTRTTGKHTWPLPANGGLITVQHVRVSTLCHRRHVLPPNMNTTAALMLH